MRGVMHRSRGRALALMSLLILACVPRGAIAADPSAGPAITARAAVVMNTETGDLIWSRNPDQQFPPASTTKIMTSILALESGRLDEYFTVSRFASAQPPSKISLRAGQQARLEDLVYALLLNSANDGAVVIAEGLGGSVDQFADMMNAKAQAIGALHTQFRNPNGLPDDDHLTTARDLGLMLRYALGIPEFRRIVGTRATEINVLGVGPRRIALHTHNRLLSGYFAPVYGKTGYTRAAGRCFVGATEYDGRQVIVVVLGSSNLWGDARRLVEYGMGIDSRQAARLQFAALERGDYGEGDVGGTPPSRGRGSSRGKHRHRGAETRVAVAQGTASATTHVRTAKATSTKHKKRTHRTTQQAAGTCAKGACTQQVAEVSDRGASASVKPGKSSDKSRRRGRGGTPSGRSQPATTGDAEAASVSSPQNARSTSASPATAPAK